MTKIWKKEYYENLLGLEKKEKTVVDYYEEIRKAQKEIEVIRLNCPHSVKELVMYMHRPGALSPSYVCKKCDVNLGSATEEDSKKAWDEWNKGFQK